MYIHKEYIYIYIIHIHKHICFCGRLRDKQVVEASVLLNIDVFGQEVLRHKVT